MDTDTVALQAAEQRVREMHERSQRLLGHAPTFGEGTPAKPKQPDDRFLLLLLLLMLSQNGGNQPLTALLAYLLI